ncbi:hypothetical protein K437DRAFT_174385 [Tilletiaria anomala UBC 951]|uniref:Uncharacterized protein n=1 Tax=Tilletiaria anomala (strain ATCC 24038 / CBS 436.72 / UBC 951) TaxID=1037660 RepID=A0A066WPT0_TILAU|nr:uncharacterized protein K437DRAFT_174385 [Tilletiaria anomala UBC 951]KDN52635.1 hypothetical protein K437DRAFT_174385 [Tilletiaria anomala UBC 951]
MSSRELKVSALQSPDSSVRRGQQGATSLFSSCATLPKLQTTAHMLQYVTQPFTSDDEDEHVGGKENNDVQPLPSFWGGTADP